MSESATGGGGAGGANNIFTYFFKGRDSRGALYTFSREKRIGGGKTPK